MERTLEGAHTRFLRQITSKRARWKADKTWVIPKAKLVREAAGPQAEMSYIGRRQGTVAQWVVLRPIIEVCAR